MDAIAKIPLFQDLSASTREAIRPHLKAREFSAGEMVLSHHEESDELFFVLEGAVRVVIYSLEGKDVVFRDIGPGEIFGELAAIDGGARSANVVTLTDSTLAVMGRAAFIHLVRDQGDVANALLQHLVSLIRRYSQRVVELSTLGVEERIRIELLRLATEHRRDDRTAVIEPAPTLAELASRVGTTREAVSREIARLTRDGLVTRERGALVVGDVPRLNEMVEPLLS